MIKCGIIGCGRIAGFNETKFNPNTHAGAYLLNKSFKLTVCYDRNIDKSKIFSDKYNCNYASTLKDFLDKYKPDVISITTPDASHFHVTKRVLSYKHLPKIIFLEKPACLKREEFLKLMELANSRKVDIIVNHTRRFDEYHSYLRKIIKEKLLGDIITVMATYYGGILHNGVHLLDTLLFLIDDELKLNEIFGKVEKYNVKDPTLEFTLTNSKENYKVKIFGMAEKYYQLFEFDIRFSKGRIRIEDFGNRIIIEKRKTNYLGENVLEQFKEFSKRSITPMQNAIDIIAKSLINNDKNILESYSFKSVYKTMNLIWEIIDVQKNQYK